MAITYIGSATGTTSASLPTGWQPGDLAIVAAFRDGSTTAPSLPSGWTNIQASGANTCSIRVGYRVLQSGDTGTGTWTNATNVVVHVYRGIDSTPIGASAVSGGSSTTVTYSALTLQVTDGTSWVAGFAGHRSTDTTIETPPTGMTNRSDSLNATAELAGHDTNGGVASWSQGTVSVGGTSSGWRSCTVEIRAAPPPTLGAGLVSSVGTPFPASTSLVLTAQLAGTSGSPFAAGIEQAVTLGAGLAGSAGAPFPASTSLTLGPELAAAPSTVFAASISAAEQTLSADLAGTPGAPFAASVNLALEAGLVSAPSAALAAALATSVAPALAGTGGSALPAALSLSLNPQLVAAPSGPFPASTSLALEAATAGSPGAPFPASTSSTIAAEIVAAETAALPAEVGALVQVEVVAAPVQVFAAALSTALGPEVAGQPGAPFPAALTAQVLAEIAGTGGSPFDAGIGPVADLIVSPDLIPSTSAAFPAVISAGLRPGTISVSVSDLAPSIAVADVGLDLSITKADPAVGIGGYDLRVENKREDVS
jgi:hypothetical protein